MWLLKNCLKDFRAFSDLKVRTKVRHWNSQIIAQYLLGSVTCGFTLQFLNQTFSDAMIVVMTTGR